MEDIRTRAAADAEHARLPRRAVSERKPNDPEAIFVVGVARSGTTMMRALLEASGRVAMAPENHFLGYYFGRRGARHFLRRAGNLADDDAVRRVVDLIYSGAYARHSVFRRPSYYWRWLVQEVPRQELERRLLAAERTERGLFRAFLRLWADVQGKPVMGEKTPTHLGHVDTLLDWFPSARVIHMLRDPRGVYVSDRYRRQVKDRSGYRWLAKVPPALAAWLLIITVFAWPRAVRRHHVLERRHPDHYMLVRFEDLVTRPAETIPRVSRFLGVELPTAPERVNVKAQKGLPRSGEGLDPMAADRWREHIHPLVRRIIELTLRGPMRAYGYLD